MEKGIIILRELMAIQIERHELALTRITDRRSAEYFRHLFEKACMEHQLDLIDTLMEDPEYATSYLQMAVDHERCMLVVQQTRGIPT